MNAPITITDTYVSPQKCEIIDVALALVMSDKLSLTCNTSFLKDNLRNIMLDDLKCTSDTNCQKLNVENCKTIILNNVSCTLCIFELDNTCNPCAMSLDESTTYTNQLTENISPLCHK